MTEGFGEFDQIKKFMAPLSEKAKGAFGLTDDAATFGISPNHVCVVTTDTLIETVHFMGDEPAFDIACKALGVNLSDLAAMGARPLYYTLNASYPKHLNESWLAAFCEGLGSMQQSFDIALIGGDTTGTPGPLTLSITAFGEVPNGAALRRNGASPGDDIWISGTLGDGNLGLKVAQNILNDPSGLLIERYRRPSPRVRLGQALVGIATACLDVSDGLLGDLGHILTHSQVGAEIDLECLPFSKAARDLGLKDSELTESALNGGDDYELLFTAPEKHTESIIETAAETGQPVTKIGRIVEGCAVKLMRTGQPVEDFEPKGFRHF